MPQEFVTGQRATDNIAAFRVHYDLSRKILELEPSFQPLIVLLNNIYRGTRRLPTKTEKFRWSEYELDDRLDSINNVGGYTDVATDLVVSTISLFYEEALVKNTRTGEVMRVDRDGVDAATDTITVTRGVGPAGGFAINDGDALLIIGGAREEGDTSRRARQRDPVEFENFTQIFKEWVEMTGTKLAAGEDTNPHDWPFQQKQKMIEHQKDKELTFWTGAPSETDIPGETHRVRTTGGVHHFAVENNADAGGPLTEVEFENWLRPALRHGNRASKVLIVSRLIASVLNNFSQGKLQTSVGDKQYGVSINRWLSAHGEVRIVVHDLFDETGYADRAYLLDFESPIAYRYLTAQAPNSNAPGESRDTRIKMNVQENDRDGRKDQVIAECGLQFGLAKRHGVLTGVTG